MKTAQEAIDEIHSIIAEIKADVKIVLIKRLLFFCKKQYNQGFRFDKEHFRIDCTTVSKKLFGKTYLIKQFDNPPESFNCRCVGIDDECTLEIMSLEETKQKIFSIGPIQEIRIFDPKTGKQVE